MQVEALNENMEGWISSSPSAIIIIIDFFRWMIRHKPTSFIIKFTTLTRRAVVYVPLHSSTLALTHGYALSSKYSNSLKQPRKAWTYSSARSHSSVPPLPQFNTVQLSRHFGRIADRQTRIRFTVLFGRILSTQLRHQPWPTIFDSKTERRDRQMRLWT